MVSSRVKVAVVIVVFIFIGLFMIDLALPSPTRSGCDSSAIPAKDYAGNADLTMYPDHMEFRPYTIDTYGQRHYAVTQIGGYGRPDFTMEGNQTSFVDRHNFILKNFPVTSIYRGQVTIFGQATYQDAYWFLDRGLYGYGTNCVLPA